MLTRSSMIGLLAALSLSVLGSAKDFDIGDLSVREVGARNTLVSRQHGSTRPLYLPFTQIMINKKNRPSSAEHN